jgi:hypothetical protein
MVRAGAVLGPSYHYAAAQSQYVDPARVRGARATFTVHAPAGVTRPGDHSLAEMAIRGRNSGDMVEAGWRTDHSGVTRLFVYWWRNGVPQCYNGCGFRYRGPGMRPGAALQPGTRLTIRWVFRNNRWVLIVNGQRSGFYPAALWGGRFTGPRLVQVFGEVVTRSLLPCLRMGNGRPATRTNAAQVLGVRFVGGPEMRLRRTTVSLLSGYSLRMINDRRFRYGGRGLC